MTGLSSVDSTLILPHRHPSTIHLLKTCSMQRVEADEVEVDDEVVVVVVVVVVVGLIPPALLLTFSTRCSEEEEEGPIASPTMTDRSDVVSSPSLHM